MAPARSVRERIADALDVFERDRDCFFATTNPDQRPNVAPLSVVWYADEFVLCTRRSTRTVKNLIERPFARLVFGATRDVVLIDAACEIRELSSVDPKTLTAFHEHVGWDIARETTRYVALVCQPETVQSWRQEPEATLMKNGAWIT
jgi:hypothetical protein